MLPGEVGVGVGEFEWVGVGKLFFTNIQILSFYIPHSVN
jgi:hypothetical protein